MNPAIKKHKNPAHRLIFCWVLMILLLPAPPLLIRGFTAEPDGPQSVRQRFKAAIPKERPGGYGYGEELAGGKFLVASRRLMDPNFRETVVLLIEYGLDGAMGLVINRPSEVRLAVVFPDIKALKQRNDTLYVGGPVAVNQVLMLIRSTRQPEQSIRVIDDVYISSSREMLERLMKNAGEDERFRLFAGYAGWAPNQLDFEKSRGDWHVLAAETEMVFSKNPDEIWPELIRRATVKWVRRHPLLTY